MEWQPIETAPKDGSRILAVSADAAFGVVVWSSILGGTWVLACSDGQALNYYLDPTHWMPLPEPPPTDKAA